MGGANSSSLFLGNVVRNLNDELTCMYNKESSSTYYNQNFTQNISVKIGRDHGCSIKTNEVMNVNLNLKHYFAMDVTQKAISDVTNKIYRAVTEAIEQTNEQLNMGQSNSSDIANSLSILNSTKIRKDITNIMNSNVRVIVKMTQSTEIVIDEIWCYPGGSIDINEYMNGDFVVKNTTKSILNTDSVSEILNDIIDKMDTKVKQKNKGINLVLMLLAIALIIFLVKVAEPGSFSFKNKGGGGSGGNSSGGGSESGGGGGGYGGMNCSPGNTNNFAGIPNSFSEQNVESISAEHAENSVQDAADDLIKALNAKRPKLERSTSS